jgi:hypothetical protein
MSKMLNGDLIKEQVNQILGYPGRLIGGSKSLYRDLNPHNIIIFNSNVCIPEGKIWYGDIDLNKDWKLLEELSTKLDLPIYIIPEMWGRFEYEDNPLIEELIAKVSFMGIDLNERYVSHQQKRHFMKIYPFEIKTINTGS